MNFAFGICVEDIENVLKKHNKQISEDRVQEIFDFEINQDAIEKSALMETDFDKQVEAAYQEIEFQLKNLGVI